MNITTASLFRLVEDLRATLLIDESEHLNNPERRGEFRALLLAGYKQDGEVFRCEGKDRKVVRPFKVYSPKMLANISGIEDVLEDRTIPYIMQRTNKPEISNREIPRDGWRELRDELYCFALSYFKDIRKTFTELQPIELDGESLHGREWELWRPLFAIVNFVFKDHGDKAKIVDGLRDLAFRTMKEKQTESVNMNPDYILALHLLSTIDEETAKTPKEIAEEIKYEYPTLAKPSKIWRSLRRIGFKPPQHKERGRVYQITRKILKAYCERHDLEIPPQTTEKKEPKLADFVTETGKDGLTRTQVYKPGVNQ